MNERLHRNMVEATRLTRAGRLADATALLQRVLRGERAPPQSALGIERFFAIWPEPLAGSRKR